MIEDNSEPVDSIASGPSSEHEKSKLPPRDEISELAVLPYRIDDLVYVLLVKPSGANRWGPLRAPRLGRGARHASAAAAARLQFGVSGRIHLSALRTSTLPNRLTVYPLQVFQYAPPLKQAAKPKWFSLHEAAAVANYDFLPVLETFGRRLHKNANVSGPGALLPSNPTLTA
ncbi:MAG: hypothetical protein JO303_17220 [Caulobacteraceae bacterium]|nr:hypothetical protein [Caulobacteraceae bacterium]